MMRVKQIKCEKGIALSDRLSVRVEPDHLEAYPEGRKSATGYFGYTSDSRGEAIRTFTRVRRFALDVGLDSLWAEIPSDLSEA